MTTRKTEVFKYTPMLFQNVFFPVVKNKAYIIEHERLPICSSNKTGKAA